MMAVVLYVVLASVALLPISANAMSNLGIEDCERNAIESILLDVGNPSLDRLSGFSEWMVEVHVWEIAVFFKHRGCPKPTRLDNNLTANELRNSARVMVNVLDAIMTAGTGARETSGTAHLRSIASGDKCGIADHFCDELFPRYDGPRAPACCRLGDPGDYNEINILDPKTWYAHDWLPPEYRMRAERSIVFEEGLKRAQRVKDIMRRTVPGVEEIVFAGDIIATKLYLYVPRRNSAWRNWTFRESRGDGTVPVWSAVNNFQTLAGSQPSFVDHATIFADEWVKNKLGRELVSTLPPPVRAEVPGEIMTLTGRRELDLVRIELEPAAVAPGQQSRLRLGMEFIDPVSRGDVRPEAVVHDSSGRHTVVIEEITTDLDLASRRLVFSGSVTAPTEEGTFRIDVTIPGQGTRSNYLTVLGSLQE